jgi:hypothetical protein
MSDARLVGEDRWLEPANGAIIDDPLAGVRCLVHSHHSDRSERRLHFWIVRTPDRPGLRVSDEMCNRCPVGAAKLALNMRRCWERAMFQDLNLGFLARAYRL